MTVVDERVEEEEEEEEKEVEEVVGTGGREGDEDVLSWALTGEMMRRREVRSRRRE
ncbi:hypothetical protein HDU67_004969, partial [Dinochytrium kinnereticum]